MIQRGEERPKEFVAVSNLTHVILQEGLVRELQNPLYQNEGKPFNELDSFYKLSPNPQ